MAWVLLKVSIDRMHNHLAAATHVHAVLQRLEHRSHGLAELDAQRARHDAPHHISHSIGPFRERHQRARA
jgi:hypothetical protein